MCPKQVGLLVDTYFVPGVGSHCARNTSFQVALRTRDVKRLKIGQHPEKPTIYPLPKFDRHYFEENDVLVALNLQKKLITSPSTKNNVQNNEPAKPFALYAAVVDALLIGDKPFSVNKTCISHLARISRSI